MTEQPPKTSDPPPHDRGGLRGLVDDARALLPRGQGAMWLALGVAAVLQVLFWYLGSPGPTLLKAAARTPETAFSAIAWSVALFSLAPLAIWLGLGRPLSVLGLRLGAWRLGLPVALGLGAVSAPVLWVVAASPDFQASYPWAGAWAGATVGNLAVWACVYVFYYFSFELFYRGFLLRLFEPLWGLNAAIWLQAVCATLVHLGKPMPETIFALPASLVLGLIAVRTRSLLWPTLVHFAIGMATDIASLSRQGWLFP